MKYIFLLWGLMNFLSYDLNAQNDQSMKDMNAPDLPYYQIPDYPNAYTAMSVAARMIDGLGFRFYWATEGLRVEDLNYKPGKEARSTAETIDHIYSMSFIILNASKKLPNEQIENKPQLTFQEKRKETLENLKKASDILKKNNENDMGSYKVVFKRGENTTEFPYWNLINGPIADCLWHVGQIVSFRRASGNPFNPKVSVFNGRIRE
ncbi:hypothetical protein [Leptobacterium sp. I13]|uniref:hypothetical protein n=1 Tax=Leptobacterium meishanense TaxID=3128904 RepID=UPI0030EBF681